MSHLEDNPVSAARPVRARRSVLYVPANNARAMQKVSDLSCDSIVFDLEDSVGLSEKQSARQSLQDWFSRRPTDDREYVIRINALSSEWGPDDLAAACACEPDALLVPKVSTVSDMQNIEEQLANCGATPRLRLWTMIETARAIANCMNIVAATARLDCLVVGTNDLAKETGVQLSSERTFLVSWLMQIILAARANGLDVLDGVYNDFRDDSGFLAECRQGQSMGFDGKTLIHPGQIEPANRIFAADQAAVAEARAIVAAFSQPENSGRGVIAMDGRMVEQLHLEQAEMLLAKATTQSNAKGSKK